MVCLSHIVGSAAPPSLAVAASFATATASSFLRKPLACQKAGLALAAGMHSSPPPQTDLSWDTGRLLAPPPSDSQWWDRLTFAGPVVVRDPFYQVKYSPYRVYYYGRDRNEWNMGVTPFNATLPTGRIGLAMSEDGIQFERFKGPLDGGAIMDPSDDPEAFDCVHVAVSDAFFRADDARWYVYYFGAGLDEHPLVGYPDRRCKGVRMQPGLTLSKDGIVITERKGPILKVGDPGSWDENGISWPRILPPWQHGDRKGALKGKWLMSYHTRENGGPNGLGFFSTGLAVSDNGVEWEKMGKVLAPGSPGSWDEGGVSVRHVIRNGYGGQFLMFYEGSNYNSEFAIGLAISDDGLVWNKDTECGPEPGGPVLKPRKGFWDNFLVGTPYMISMYDGSLRMYYVGFGKKEGETTITRGIGLALSDKSNFRAWRRYSPSDPGPLENKRGFEPPKRRR